jgi:hypothetical protein
MCRIAPESVHLNRRESICRESGVNIFLTFVPRFFAAPIEQKTCAQSHLRGDAGRGGAKISSTLRRRSVPAQLSASVRATMS